MRSRFTRHRAIRTLAALAMLAATVGLGSDWASATHDDALFELGPPLAADILSDGDAATGPDWAQLLDGSDVVEGIFDASGAAVLPEEGLASAFIKDDSAQKGLSDRTTYSGTSNKNNDALSFPDCDNRVPPLTGSGCAPWVWDSGNVPAKDDLFNVYAYAANDDQGTPDDSDDHLIVYAGVERLAPEGDSHLDLEFLQDQISLDELIPCNDPGSDPTPCHFEGVRTPEDIIVSMDYLNGGGVGEVHIRSWDGSEYVEVGLAGGEGCFSASGGTGDDICVANNGAPINGGPWVNQDRGNKVITDLPTNSFTEFGIDVTALLGGDTPCISSFLPKTRSSASFTAELKDFAGPANFSICGADIQIGDDATNEVGDPHTFTVNVNQKLGSQTNPAPDGTHVDVTLTDANGAVSDISSNTCDTTTDPPGPGTVNGQCTITFTSETAGTVTAHASATLTIAGTSKTVETDGQGTNSDDAVKTFVDASITINPTATNSVGENHTFTVTVKQDAGDATGEVNAPDGTVVDVDLTDAGGAAQSTSSDTCASPGTVNGQCTVTFTSATAGTVTGHASVTLTVGGLSITRATDGNGGNSGDAVKTFVDGSIAWTKVDNAGALQGGATFQVCRTHNFNSDTLAFDDVTDVCFDVADDVLDDDPDATAPDADNDPGEFRVTGLRLGRYTVTETVAPPGFEKDPDTVTVNLSLANPDATISTAFVNNRPIVKITGFGYTNTPTGTPTAGVLSGTSVFTATMKNFGGADVNVSGVLTVTANNSQGTFSCTAPSPVSYGPSLLQKNAANTVTVTTTCTYSNVNDGAVVTANLTSNYTLNGLTRAASGSPAAITFTVQGD